MSEERREGLAGRAALGLLILAVAVPRLWLSTCVSSFGADGSFYTDIARNVRDGRGLVTDVSVFHHAFPHFPHPTSTYPLWPLLYGYLSRLAPLEAVGIWVPTALFVAATGLSYAIGRRLVPRPLFPGLPLHGGHVLAALFATNAELAVATSRPYTEGLAFVLLFSLLLRGRVLWRSPGLLAGLELGLWLIALFLTRSQFLVVGLAALATLPVALIRRPKEAALLLLGMALGFSAIWQIYARWLGTFLPDPTLGTYLRLDLARLPGDRLSVVPFLVDPGSMIGRALEPIQSLGPAFSLNGALSYHALHRGSAYALPVAAVVLASRWRRWPAVLRLLRGPQGAGIAFVHLVALALTASLHTVHQIYGPEWIFGSRMAIPSVLLVGIAILYLLGSRLPPIRAVAIFLLCAGLYGTWSQLVLEADEQCRNAASGKSFDSYRPGLRKWLISERERLGGLTVAAERPEAQLLSWRTPGVGFHWLTESTTLEDLGVMVTDLGVRYVVLFDDVNNVRLSGPELERLLAPIPWEGDARDEGGARQRPTRIYAPRCSAFPGLSTCVDR